MSDQSRLLSYDRWALARRKQIRHPTVTRVVPHNGARRRNGCCAPPDPVGSQIVNDG